MPNPSYVEGPNDHCDLPVANAPLLWRVARVVCSPSQTVQAALRVQETQQHGFAWRVGATPVFPSARLAFASEAQHGRHAPVFPKCWFYPSIAASVPCRVLPEHSLFRSQAAGCIGRRCEVLLPFGPFGRSPAHCADATHDPYRTPCCVAHRRLVLQRGGTQHVKPHTLRASTSVPGTVQNPPVTDAQRGAHL